MGKLIDEPIGDKKKFMGFSFLLIAKVLDRLTKCLPKIKLKKSSGHALTFMYIDCNPFLDNM